MLPAFIRDSAFNRSLKVVQVNVPSTLASKSNSTFCRRRLMSTLTLPPVWTSHYRERQKV